MSKRIKKPVGAVRRADYPALCDFLDGYLHQDFTVVHGNVAGAAMAYVDDANTTELAALEKELHRFLEVTAGMSADRVGDLITHELGGAWSPQSRIEIENLLAVLSAESEQQKRS